jgi:hypothetical protein
MPLTPLEPNKNPVTIGLKITKRPGPIIYLMLDFVDISMHLW